MLFPVMIGACGLVRQLAEPFETEHTGLFNRISPEGGKTPRVSQNSTLPVAFSANDGALGQRLPICHVYKRSPFEYSGPSRNRNRASVVID